MHLHPIVASATSSRSLGNGCENMKGPPNNLSINVAVTKMFDGNDSPGTQKAETFPKLASCATSPESIGPPNLASHALLRKPRLLRVDAAGILRDDPGPVLHFDCSTIACNTCRSSADLLSYRFHDSLQAEQLLSYCSTDQPPLESTSRSESWKSKAEDSMLLTQSQRMLPAAVACVCACSFSISNLDGW